VGIGGGAAGGVHRRQPAASVRPNNPIAQLLRILVLPDRNRAIRAGEHSANPFPLRGRSSAADLVSPAAM
jgi:hypothetical protein